MSKNKTKTEATNENTNQVEALVMPHPHLFANGQFKIKVYDTIYNKWTYYKNNICTVNDSGFTSCLGYRDIKNCKLIARPISDMTDDEIYDVPMNEQSTGPRKNPIWRKNDIINIVNDDAMTFNSVLYLLSIGVYPFDQTYFEKDWLIDGSAA